MTKVIVHIGSAKTGSTVLQKHVFPKLAMEGFCYFGKIIDHHDAGSISGRFIRAINSIGASDFEKIKSSLKIELQRHLRCYEKVLLSDESFTIKSVAIGFEISVAEKIRRINELFSYSELSYIIVCRKQTEAVPSLYVELNDFYKKVLGYADINKIDDSWRELLDVYDYDYIRSIVEQEHRKPLFVLSYSKMKTNYHEFLDDFFHLMGLSVDASGFDLIVRENDKKIDKNGNKITEKNSVKRRFELYMIRKIGSVNSSSVKRFKQNKVIRFFWGVFSVVASRIPVGGGGSVEIDEGIVGPFLHKYYEKSNVRFLKSMGLSDDFFQG